LELEICYANVELTPEQKMASLCGISQKDGFACALWTAPSSAPERRHEAGAGNPTDAPR
jgi:hypothetical protein